MRPLRFRPLYQPRVWGGRELERLFGRELPDDGQPYGESWEIVDRPEAQSIVDGGAFDGLTLHDLWTDHRDQVFGAGTPASDRFPLLLKVLDARQDLSLQVHPPAAVAASLGGEPKTEMWYVADAQPGAALYAGVAPGTTPDDFARSLAQGTAAELVHRLDVRTGDFIFIPSGRLHAIGAGLVIFEIQQNSDTTYRVFDWNRTGLDGKPRELHIEASLRCIDFADTSPALGASIGDTLVACDYFRVSLLTMAHQTSRALDAPGAFVLLTMIRGRASLAGETLGPGDHLLLPAAATDRVLHAFDDCRVLTTTLR